MSISKKESKSENSLTNGVVIAATAITLAGLTYAAYSLLTNYLKHRNTDLGDTKRSRSCRELIPQQILDRYEIGELLGEGTYACVFGCTNAVTKSNKFAIKVIPRKIVHDKHLVEFSPKFLEVELAILRQCDHPNILRLVDSQWTKKALVFVTERAFGGVLFDKIVEIGNYNENIAKIIFAQLLEATKYLHEVACIIHRDLKPENILLMDDGLNENEFGVVKICDFGVSKMWTRTEKCSSSSNKKKRLLRTSTVTGTPGYQAPEIIVAGDYGTGVDLWSLGIILHAMLCGELPATVPPTFTSYNSETSNAWEIVSDAGKKLVARMLQHDPANRPSASEALKSDWLQTRRRLSKSESATKNWAKVRESLRETSQNTKAEKKEKAQKMWGKVRKLKRHFKDSSNK
jgi:serine/threonine protein kinase